MNVCMLYDVDSSSGFRSRLDESRSIVVHAAQEVNMISALSCRLQHQVRRQLVPSLAVVQGVRRNISLKKRRPRKIHLPLKDRLAKEKEEALYQMADPSERSLLRPMELQGDTMADYIGKASLSPWVPVPDPAARKMLELAKAGKDDVSYFPPQGPSYEVQFDHELHI